MTNRNKTEIVVIVDRSGSMTSCRADAEGGLNTFIEQQRNQPGECLLTLVQFDHDYEFVHSGKPIAEVGKFTLNPRGSTALLDAVGRAITETGERLAKMPEDDRPGLVVFVILTDGQENASREFRRDQIKQMIEHQTTNYNWQFTYLGANQDAFGEAGSLGISGAAAMNYVPSKSSKAFQAASSNVTRMRSSASVGDVVAASYTNEERQESV